MFLLNGTPLGIDSPFTYNDTQYPSNWLRLASQEERAAIGITEVADPALHDDRFYWGHDNPKDLFQLKDNWSSQIKDTTNKLLSESDWMVIRKVERNVDIPPSTATYRAAVLTESKRITTAITASEDVPSLITAVTTQDWPKYDYPTTNTTLPDSNTSN
jgi:hypothetical protein